MFIRISEFHFSFNTFIAFCVADTRTSNSSLLQYLSYMKQLWIFEWLSCFCLLVYCNQVKIHKKNRWNNVLLKSTWTAGDCAMFSRWAPAAQVLSNRSFDWFEDIFINRLYNWVYVWKICKTLNRIMIFCRTI